MVNLSLTQNQFQIAIGMSEAKILSVISNQLTDKLLIEVNGINILYDFTNLKVLNPEMNYDDWLRIKYQDNQFYSEQWEHIFIKDKVSFVIDKPDIFYQGNQDEFLDLLVDLDLYTIEDPKYTFVFGGVYEKSDFDEFEVFSDSPIELIISEDSIKDAVNNAGNQEMKIEEFNSTLDTVKERQRKKDKLNKRYYNNLEIHGL